MGEQTNIGWTDHTASPWWGCLRVSPGCERCYAEQLSVVRRKLPVWGPPSTTERKRIASALPNIAKWNRAAKRDGVRRRLFVASMCDIFEDHPQVAPWRAEALSLLADSDGLDVQLLTKRPENILRMVPAAWLQNWPTHVWIGCTVEDQRRADERIPELLKVPARVRFLSCEPLLEAVLLPVRAVTRRCTGCGAAWFKGGPAIGDPCPAEPPESSGCTGTVRTGIQWVIVGGESGPGARPFDLQWARSIVAQCKAAGVAVFVKQVGDNAIDSARYDVIGSSGRVHYSRDAGDAALTEARGTAGYVVRPLSVSRLIRAHHGADPREWPPALQVQEFPREVSHG